MKTPESLVLLVRIRGAQTYDYSGVQFRVRLRLAWAILRGGKFTTPANVGTDCYGYPSQLRPMERIWTSPEPR